MTLYPFDDWYIFPKRWYFTEENEIIDDFARQQMDEEQNHLQRIRDIHQDYSQKLVEERYRYYQDKMDLQERKTMEWLRHKHSR